jgi:predicted DNA binding protein
VYLETKLKVGHSCCFSRLSSRFPFTRMSLWSTGSAGVLRVESPDSAELHKVIDAARRDFDSREAEVGLTGATLFMTCHILRHRALSVMAVADRSGVWPTMPIGFRDGAETYRVISPDKTFLRRFLTGLEGVSSIQVLSHRTRERADWPFYAGETSGNPLDHLTPIQQDALATAFESGLLQIPARRTMEEVAREFGISRSTFGEHLRKAQGRLVRNVYPLLHTDRRVRAHSLPLHGPGLETAGHRSSGKPESSKG